MKMWGKLLLILFTLLAASPAFAAIAFDAATESVRTGIEDPYEFTHTPSGTPKGIAVTAIHGTSNTSHIDGITYGGVAMTRVNTAWTSSAEPGRAEMWYLGASIPTGAQTVSVNLSSATTDDYQFVAISFTAATDTEPIDAGQISPKTTTNLFPADPSRTLYYRGQTAISIGVQYSGHADGSTITPNANCTTVADHDFGAFAGEVIRQTTPGTSDFAVGTTAASDDAAYVSAAFSEVALTGFAFPSSGPIDFIDKVESVDAATSATYSMTQNPVINAGDLLIAFVAGSNTAATTVGITGWTVIDQDNSAGNNSAVGILAKKAVGDEDGAAVTVTWDQVCLAFTAQSYRIPADSWFDSGTLANDVEGTIIYEVSAAPNPPSLNPTNWDVEKTMWFAAVGGFYSGTFEVPANYTFGERTFSTDQAPEVMYTAMRKSEAASEDPGAFTVGVDANYWRATVAVRPASAVTIVLDDNLPDGTVSVAYTGDVIASGGTAPYTYAVSAGSLPTGLSLSAAGVLSGTPTTAGTYAFTIEATDDDTNTGDADYSIVIDAVTAAFPQLLSTTTTVVDTAATTHLILMPPIVNSGDLILIPIVVDDAGINGVTITTPSGWTAIGTIIETGYNRLSLYAKAADGTEDGLTVDFVTSSATKMVAQTFRWIGWLNSGTLANDIEVATFDAGATFTPDPASLNPTNWDIEKTAWLVAASRRDNNTLIIYPSGYSNGLQTKTGANAANLGSVTLESETASIDPGVFTYSGNFPAFSSTMTIAIRPAVGGVIGGAFPQCEDCTQTTTDVNDTDYSLNLPSVVDPSDLLLVIANAVGPSTAVAAITGFTLLGTLESNNDYAAYVLAKDAVGDEDGDTVTIDFGQAMTSFSGQVYRITSWADSGTLANDVQISNVNAANTADPPSLAPSGGAEALLWITAVTHGIDCTVTVAPANFSNLLTSDSGAGAAAYIASSRRELNAASLDAGTFTEGCTGNIGSWTIAVAPVGCPTIDLDDTLSDGSVSQPYTGQLTASGGDSPYTYLVTSGSPPAGVVLDASGTLSGTPGIAELSTFVVEATDDDGCTGSRAYAVNIIVPPTEIDFSKRKTINTGWWRSNCFGNCQRGFVSVFEPTGEDE